MSLEAVVLGTLAVWRITHLLQAEDGPWDLSVRLRRAAGAGFWGQLLDCFYCLSLWMSAPTAALLAPGWGQGILMWLGLSGGAILLERLTTRPQHRAYPEDQDAVLWQQTPTAQPDAEPAQK